MYKTKNECIYQGRFEILHRQVKSMDKKHSIPSLDGLNRSGKSSIQSMTTESQLRHHNSGSSYQPGRNLIPGRSRQSSFSNYAKNSKKDLHSSIQKIKLENKTEEVALVPFSSERGKLTTLEEQGKLANEVVHCNNDDEFNNKLPNFSMNEVKMLSEYLAVSNANTENVQDSKVSAKSDGEETETKEDLQSEEKTANETEQKGKTVRSIRNGRKKKLYKLTAAIKAKLQKQNPVLSGRLLDHYYAFGKPPFLNFGHIRNLRLCRY